MLECVSQSAGLCPSTQQIRDGWRTLWGDRGERLWLARWKFVDSALSHVTETRSIHLSWMHRTAMISHWLKGAFGSHVCVRRVWRRICWIHCFSSTGLAFSATSTGQWIRFVETLSFSHLWCLWRHAVSSQALPASPEIRSRTSALALRAQIVGYCS